MRKFKTEILAILLILTLFTACRLSTNQLSDQVQMSMVETWQQEKITGIEIKSLILTHKSGNEYSGLLETLEDGETFKYSVEVVYDGQNFQWEIIY
jgi:hypothetical protein